MTESWEKALAIAEAVLALRESERAPYLDTACGDDSRLRKRVDTLLDQAGRPDSFLDRGPGSMLQPGGTGAGETPPDDHIRLGTELGAWRIVRRVASGGMGTVYEAVRADRHFEKRVAIKVIKAGMDSAEILRRFRNERQVLAALEHPGIARLIDGGATEQGRPFLVMEYVDGKAIDDYCDEADLSLEDRLALFVRVCCAVQSAHEARVVHRDLKPSNVLVTPSGDPKLLDFGIAKVLESQPGGATEITVGPARTMTPEYATPEQVCGDRVTPATDVYALGLLLFEILTGRRPFDHGGLTWTEIERMVLEVPPPRASDVAAGRHRRALRGDLDNIVQQALRKEPERRYACAAELADDIGRCLAGMPVRARPDSALYHVRKFVGRNRFSVGAAAVVVVVATASLVISSIERDRTVRANTVAEHRGEQARSLAQTYLRDLDGLLVKIAGTTEAREFAVETGLRYLLDAVADAGSDPDPELMLEVARGYTRIGDIQGNPLRPNLGKREDARHSYERSLEFAQRLHEGNPDNPHYRAVLALSHHRLGVLEEISGSIDKARERFRRAREVCEGAARGAVNAVDDPGSARGTRDAALDRVRLQISNSLATLALHEGEHDRALAHAENHLRLAREVSDGSPGAEALFVGAGIARRSQVLCSMARVTEAEADLEEAIALSRSALEEAPNDAELVRQLSFALNLKMRILQHAGRLEECVQVGEEVITVARGLLAQDPESQDRQRGLLVVLIQHGNGLLRARQHEQFRHVAEEQVTLATKLAAADPDSLGARRDLIAARVMAARAAVLAGRPGDALPSCLAAARDADTLIAARPEDAEAREIRAKVDWDLGKIYRKLGEREKDPEQRLQYWVQAQGAFQRGLDAIRALSDEDRLTPVLRRYLGRWERDLRQSSDVIAKIRAGY